MAAKEEVLSKADKRDSAGGVKTGTLIREKVADTSASLSEKSG